MQDGQGRTSPRRQKQRTGHSPPRIFGSRDSAGKARLRVFAAAGDGGGERDAAAAAGGIVVVVGGRAVGAAITVGQEGLVLERSRAGGFLRWWWWWVLAELDERDPAAGGQDLGQLLARHVADRVELGLDVLLKKLEPSATRRRRMGGLNAQGV